MIDKLLLLLLIILLPIGIVASRQLFQPVASSDKLAEAQAKKVDEIISKLNNRSDVKVATPEGNSFTISAVVYASDSAVVKVAGLAPQGNVSVVISATVIPAANIPELTSQRVVNADVLGQSVTIKAIKPQADGTFNYEYPIKETQGILELTLVQGKASVTIQYDLALKKRVL